MKKNLINRLAVFMQLLCLAAVAEGETFRVHKTIPVSLTVDGDEQVESGINDCIVVFLPEDRTYFRGIEITVKIPSDIAKWRDSVAYSLYDSIQPVPDAKLIDYQGTRRCVGTLPASLSWTMQIPLIEGTKFEETPYTTVIPFVPDTKQKFVFFRLQLAMKGVPETVLNDKLDIRIRPLLTDEGRLKLQITGPIEELKPYTVFIDDTQITPEEGGNLLKTGIHTVSIVSDFYRNEIRTVQVDQAQTSQLSVVLRDIAPTITITAPETARVFLDENTVSVMNKDFVVTTGEHKVRFVIGDYEVTKTVNAQNGHSYKISLSIDATVTETE